MKDRYPELDALRGIAALIVMIGHHLLVFPEIFPNRPGVTDWAAILMFTPLHLFWAGGEMVSLFFVLSGFVLSLAYWRGRRLDMVQFIPRRILRLWVPLMVAVTASWLIHTFTGRAHVPGTSAWVDQIGDGAGLIGFMQHFFMLGPMDNYAAAFTATSWSMRWEMWGSLLIPLILLIARQPPIWVIAGLITARLTLDQLGWDATTQGLVQYGSMFVLGALLARYRHEVSHWIQMRTPVMRPILLILACLLITAHWYRYPLPLNAARVADIGVQLGIAGIIALCLGWEALRRWMQRPALQFLGRVSYSLYLWHVIVLALLLRTLGHILPFQALLIPSLIAGLFMAHIAYRWIESPVLRRLQRKDSPLSPLSPDHPNTTQ